MGVAQGIKDIAQDISSSYDARVTEVGRLKNNAREMLGSFGASHKKMGLALRKDLAGHVRAVKDDTTKMRRGIRASHKDMSTKLKQGLAQGEAERKKASAELKGELVEGAAARQSGVKGMLKDFRSSHKQMGAQLGKELADYDRGMKSEVAGMRQETKADLKEARNTWQGMAHTMEAKRGGVKVAPEVEITDLEAKGRASRSIRRKDQAVTSQ